MMKMYWSQSDSRWISFNCHTGIVLRAYACDQSCATDDEIRYI